MTTCREPSHEPPVLILTQGDPAGIGPEILLKLIAEPPLTESWRPLLIVEKSAVESLKGVLNAPWERLVYFDSPPTRGWLGEHPDVICVLDPTASSRQIRHGNPGPEDAAGALAALDAGVELTLRRQGDALVTAPMGKEVISRHLRPDFRGHTDYIARTCGETEYGRDYLMGFLTPDLQVALLTTHLPLKEALDKVTVSAVVEALSCLERTCGGRIAVAGMNPHAGENGLLGTEEETTLGPAVEEARRRGIDAWGPESADSLFARARQGEFDWVLALYHDQGLVAVKSASFGEATNWTLGLPIVRTSVDHGTAYAIAGQGRANADPLRSVVRTTLRLLRGELPRKR